jgi:beta-mannosidase
VSPPGPVADQPLAGRRRIELGDGWELAGAAPDAHDSPSTIDGLDWRPARVPGTAAGALPEHAGDFDACDWWFRVRFAADPVRDGEEVVLGLEGLATIAEVHLNGEPVLAGESMFARHVVDVGAQLGDDNELAICCRALGPRMEGRRKPRARWRTRLVAANLRFYRTMLIGRAPGFAPGPAVVGPWGPVWLERRRGVLLEDVRLRSRAGGDAGVVSCTGALRAVGGAPLPPSLTLSLSRSDGGDRHEADLRVAPESAGRAVVGGQVVASEVELWWPHTHGHPALYDVEIATGDSGEVLHRSRLGFRTLEAPGDLAADGLALHINGEPVFARGAVWTPPSLRDLTAGAEPILRAVVEGGMNMIRVPGIGSYESDAFYACCDALGILVWQDFMFANLDYPEADPDFMDTIRAEARALLRRIGSRPSLAVLCGGSEVAQQVAMQGLDPALADGPLYGELLPAAIREAEVDAPYVPSAPWGGDLPFRTDRGVSNYYGVGAYRRPLSDARLAGVRFAAECLAFANVPDDAALEDVGAVGGAAWKAGVPRDMGAGWDFDDIRDHYLETLFGVDPVMLRSVDPERFLELSRAVSGEVMAETFGEWRRAGSPCGGGLVLWLKDVMPGAGWGLLDHRGRPKVAYRHLARALAPVAVWSTDEGLNGIAVHVANDRPGPLAARLRVALYRDFEQLVDEAVAELQVPGHATWEGNVETLLGRFVDVTWAYRFGPPAQDLVAVSLERGDELVSQVFRFPVGRPAAPQPLSRIGLHGTLARDGAQGARVLVGSGAFAYGVRVEVPGWVADDDAFGVEPGHQRVISLRPVGQPAWPPADGAALSALNVAGRVRIEVSD